MKRISYSLFTWSFWIMPVAMGWICFRQENQQTIWPRPLPFLGYAIAYWLIFFVSDLIFGTKVYDDGDALVMIKRGRAVRIPFSTISRVSYQGGTGVTLQFSAPCELGSQFRFLLTRQRWWSSHNEVADDLRRRSRCCEDPVDVACAAHPS